MPIESLIDNREKLDNDQYLVAIARAPKGAFTHLMLVVESIQEIKGYYFDYDTQRKVALNTTTIKRESQTHKTLGIALRVHDYLLDNSRAVFLTKTQQETLISSLQNDPAIGATSEKLSNLKPSMLVLRAADQIGIRFITEDDLAACSYNHEIPQYSSLQSLLKADPASIKTLRETTYHSNSTCLLL